MKKLLMALTALTVFAGSVAPAMADKGKDGIKVPESKKDKGKQGKQDKPKLPQDNPNRDHPERTPASPD